MRDAFTISHAFLATPLPVFHSCKNTLRKPLPVISGTQAVRRSIFAECLTHSRDVGPQYGQRQCHSFKRTVWATLSL